MIYLNGVNLIADDVIELHEIARKFGIDRGWWDVNRECYDVICPFKLDSLRNWLGRYKKYKNGE